MALQNEFYTGDQSGNVSPTVLSQTRITTAGNVYMAKLGPYMFSLDTAAFQELQRQTEYRWAMINRIGRKPAAQFTGFGEDTITLTGSIYPHFRGGIRQIEQMRAMAGNGEGLQLVYAFGRFGQHNGLWCIKSIQENRSYFFQDGTPRKIDFTLTLTAYGEDFGAQDSVIELPMPVAIADIPAPAGLPTVDLLAGAVATATWDETRPTADIAKKMGDICTTCTGIIEKAKARVQGMVQSALSAIPADALDTARELYSTATTIADSVNQAREQFDMLKSNATELRAAAKRFENDLRHGHRGLSQLGGLLKGGGINKSTQLGTDAIMAAASLRNAANAADHMIFAVNETARQIATLGEKNP